MLVNSKPEIDGIPEIGFGGDTPVIWKIEAEIKRENANTRDRHSLENAAGCANHAHDIVIAVTVNQVDIEIPHDIHTQTGFENKQNVSIRKEFFDTWKRI